MILFNKSRYWLIERSLFFVLVFLLLVGCTSGEYIVVIEDKNNDDFYYDNHLTHAINQNCKYVLTQWWNEPKGVAFQPTSYIPNAKPLTEEQQIAVNNSMESFKNWRNEKYLLIPNWQKSDCSEQAILPPCYACRIISSAIHYGFYDAHTTGVSKEEATKKIVLLTELSQVNIHSSSD